MALRFLFTAAALGLEASRVLWERAALIAVTPVSPFPSLLGARRAAGRRDREGMTASLRSVGSPPRRGVAGGPPGTPPRPGCLQPSSCRRLPPARLLLSGVWNPVLRFLDGTVVAVGETGKL